MAGIQPRSSKIVGRSSWEYRRKCFSTWFNISLIRANCACWGGGTSRATSASARCTATSSCPASSCTVCHLIRRQALREEFGARPEQFHLAFPTFRIANQSKYSLMMQGSHLNETLLLGERSTAEFIRPAQCGFASAGRIFTQRRAVLVFKTRARLRLASNRDLHGLIPVSRETRTSASSFPLRYCSRILSAALCGFSRAERVTEKSLRTPSVAKKSASPRTIGSTVA